MITILDFYADWCGPCLVQKPILEKFASENADRVTVVKIDVDQDQAKAQQYGVMSIPTLVLEKNGEQVDRKTGLQPEVQLKKWIESHL